MRVFFFLLYDFVLQMREREEQQRRERSISPEIPADDFGSGQRAFMDSVRSHGGRVVVVTHPRTANNHKELTVVRGEYLEVSKINFSTVK